eukprot:scaffold770_cov109-Cylindrotheca_fusiformis.AAC.13
MADTIEIREKMSEYSGFIEKILRPEYQLAKKLYQTAKQEIDEYKELQQCLLKQQQQPTKQHEDVVDLGFETMFCRAEATDMSKIFVHVGMGFHVEFTILEALKFVVERITFLEQNTLAAKERKMVEVGNHLDEAEIAFRQLATELQRNA